MQSVAGVSRLDASSARLIRCSSQVYSAAVSSLAAALVYDALADHHEGMLALGRSLRTIARADVTAELSERPSNSMLQLCKECQQLKVFL